jgi:hypothetical protein
MQLRRKGPAPPLAGPARGRELPLLTLDTPNPMGWGTRPVADALESSGMEAELRFWVTVKGSLCVFFGEADNVFLHCYRPGVGFHSLWPHC